jgi:Hemolysin activation/secretion protein
VDVQNVPEPLRERLQALTNPIVGQRGIRLSQIERQILLAGDTYGVALGSALQAGATPGGTVILLDPEYKQTTGFFGLDNSISDDLGGWKFDSGVELNGALGFGEVIYARASGNPSGFFSDDPTLRTLSFGGVVPLGFNGLTLNLEANQSLSTADTDPEAPSEFERYSVRLYYPWVRSRARNITTQLSFDVQNDRQDVVIGGVEQGVYKDELRVLRLSGDGFWLTPQGGSVELGARLSLGLDSMGARSADDVNGGTPLSTPGADADFTKLELTGRYRMPLNEVYQLTVNGRVQTSFGEPLVRANRWASPPRARSRL